MTSESRASTANSSLTYHRIIEAFKFGYSWRARLGDPAFVSGISEVGKITTDVSSVCFVAKWRCCSPDVHYKLLVSRQSKQDIMQNETQLIEIQFNCIPQFFFLFCIV